MRIAFITYETPPDMASGGIGTYMTHATRMLAGRGHHVEVFAGTLGSAARVSQDGYTVHRLPGDYTSFPTRAAAAFARRHAEVGFDVLEGPDCGAEAEEAVQLVPTIPLVVKIHTPIALLKYVAWQSSSVVERLRVLAGAWVRRGRPYWSATAFEDRERRHAVEADDLAAPTEDSVRLLGRIWALPPDRFSVFPLPYTPRDLRDASRPAARGGFVTYFGRLERRKGVFDLAEAVPRVVRQVPTARFRLIGRDMSSSKPSVTDRLRALMGDSQAAVEFVPPVPPEQVAPFLQDAAVCVFPSWWESFGYVCAEAMAAGRPVVASSSGSMRELLDDGRCGLLIAPGRPRALADAVVSVLREPDHYRLLAEHARARVADLLSYDRVAAAQEASYRRAIARRRARGPRETTPGPAWL